MKNLTLKTCLMIFKKHDSEMFDYIKDRDEKSLNMDEISGSARRLKARAK